MAGFSDYLENSILNATLRGGVYTGGAVYVALFRSDPTDANVAGSELNDSAYQRQRAHTSAVSDGFSAPDATGKVSNAKQLVFPAIAGPQATITHVGIFDALTGGNLLYFSALAAPKTLDPTDYLSIAPGTLTVQLD